MEHIFLHVLTPVFLDIYLFLYLLMWIEIHMRSVCVRYYEN